MGRNRQSRGRLRALRILSDSAPNPEILAAMLAEILAFLLMAHRTGDLHRYARMARRLARALKWYLRVYHGEERGGYWLNVSRSRIARITRGRYALSWMYDGEPEVVNVSDGEGWSGKVWIVELSEDDLRMRQKFLMEKGSSENSRRGRAQRNRSEDFHPERMRQFNFEKSIIDWDFVYPNKTFNRESRQWEDHPQAGQKVQVNRETIKNIRGRVAEQIEQAIDDLNGAPEELPEVRDEEGNVVEEAVESPTVEKPEDSAVSGSLSSTG